LRVLITLAVDPEFAAWRKFRRFEQTAIGDLTVYRAPIGRANLEVVVTGMGPENASRAVEMAMSVPPAICISSGFAGALRPEHKAGDVLVARTVKQMEKSKSIESSIELVARAQQTGAKCVEAFLTSERVVGRVEEKKRLAPFADAVDMESSTILAAAHERSVPSVAIRVISDGFDQSMPVEFGKAIDERGRVRARGVVREIVRRPAILPSLIRLGRESKTAAESLANFLEAYIKEISLSTDEWTPAEVFEVAPQ
jgi:adenosylhomocysteine nucleosidase